jgi:hypothetical protein
MRDDRRRDKPTWRDRDSARSKPREDRSPSREAPSQPGYRAQLERLFASGGIAKLVEEREKAQAEGRDAKIVLPGQAPPPAPAPELPRQAVSSRPQVPPQLPGVDGQRAEAVEKARAKGKKGKAPVGEPTRAELLELARNAVGRDAITTAIDVFIGKYGWPEDFDALCQALEHRDDARIAEAMAAVGKLLERQQPRRGRALAARLRALEETSGDPELRTAAGQLRARLA